VETWELRPGIPGNPFIGILTIARSGKLERLGRKTALRAIGPDELGKWIRLCGRVSRLPRGLGYNQDAVAVLISKK
jgi:hypothetical protein